MRVKKRLVLCALIGMLSVLPALSSCKTNGGESDGGAQISEESSTAQVSEDSSTAKTYEVRFAQSAFTLAAVASADTAVATAEVYCDGELFSVGKPVYSVDQPSVVTIDGQTGALKAVSAGTAEISAKYTADGKTATAKATVRVLAVASSDEINSYDEQYVNIYGRTYKTGKKLVLDNVCTGLEISFVGTELKCSLSADGKGKIRTFVDGDTEGTETIVSGKSTEYSLCDELSAGLHTVRILKASSPQYNRVYLSENALSTDGQFFAAGEQSELKIEFIGDSITAGCGALGTSDESNQTVENSDPTKAYAYLAAQALSADFSIIAQEGFCAKDGVYNMYNAYQQYSPVCNTQKFDISSFDADFVVLALGENDMWHATSSDFEYTVEEFRADYADMLRLIRKNHPQAKIVCLYSLMPASSTSQAKQTIESAISDVDDANITLLQMICNERGANFHPNAQTHASNAKKLSSHIKKLIG